VGRRRRPGRSKRTYTLLLLVLASVTIITLDYRGGGQGAISDLRGAAHDVFSPIQRGVDSAVRPVGNFLSGAVHYGSLAQENAQLRHQLGIAEQQALEYQAAEQALAAQEKLLHLPWVGDTKTVMALVVEPSTSNFVATIELDKGTSSGVEDGMPVVGGKGLVGIVTQAWKSGCSVRLITDPASVVDVRFGNPPTDAELQGEGLGRALTLDLVPPGTPLHKGEVLTTSGLPLSVFPPGVPVAKVRKFLSSPSATQESVSATPLADVSELQYVDVMLWQPS